MQSLVWHPESQSLLALALRGEGRRRRGGWGHDSDEDEAFEDADAWSADALHQPSDFGVQWDLPYSEHAVVLQYQFKQSPAQPSPTMKSWRTGEDMVAKWRNIGEAYMK